MSTSFDTPTARKAFDRLLAELRPKLHRYCARMTGSVIDGEDVVQEALLKVIEALDQTGALANPEAWVFRIAHNAALDFLRRRARQQAIRSDEDPDMIVDTATSIDTRLATAASMRTFMRLPVAQRSSIILMDVLGYSLGEIGTVTGVSIAAIKASLHRGRARLREVAHEPDHLPLPALDGPQRALLAAYVDRFNARDFDAVRDMLADEVRLHDPEAALDGGRDGLVAYRAILTEVARVLDTRGLLVLEIGVAQDAGVAELASRAGYEIVTFAKDLAGLPRALVLTRPRSRFGAYCRTPLQK